MIDFQALAEALPKSPVDLAVIVESLPQMLQGMQLTVELTLISLAIGFSCSIGLAMLRLSRHPVLWMPVYGFVFFFRGTPLLVQIFLIYYGSGQFRFQLMDLGLWVYFRDAYFCAVLTLTLNTAAYTTEILRGAIRAVPHGEIEAARACGMSGSLLYRRIILPKAFRYALPAYSNEVVFLFQATSLVSIITLMDLTGVARTLVSKTFDVYEIFITAGLLYLAVTYAILGLFRRVEHRWSGHLRDRPDEAKRLRGPLAGIATPML
ncbi:octopine/nopaline transport system permease protein/arginine/ornithine transport system permease protein [Tistlia consotensis]|uniref:Octopine/nopaline transport system permease protein/arginine/ornithine transport system permease protein n=1 Tax=Tistlia consotensis USBA 355 TaxID=560819 RepID=A0A1Y6BIC9_9PROT|nr:ABC transporter permease [Tistlia consotensis]SMF11718.1 octopine/nopaline transport system permease protein/arginine/ornithine transport system permease protein [Tistlia consotensis USBA 355]SNR51710.1 octopine/nopaline transport system permease protein/arginine/ornithine transport system permease protein [Tistlia consotensis]